MSQSKSTKKIIKGLLPLLSAIALTTVAYEAPVVDVQPDSNNTQIESVSGQWKNMPASGAEDGNAQMQADSSQAQSVQEEAPADSGSVSVVQLQQQVQNMAQMNLPQQIIDLRQTVAELQGKVQVLTRNLQMVTAQQKSFYQDLTTQMAALKKSNGQAAVSDATQVSASNTVTSQKVVAAQPTAETPTSSDTAAYQNAFKLLSHKKLGQARTAFLAYLKNHPEGQFVPNAYYWLGEIAYADKEYNDAMTAFETVVTQFPASNKVADAKLKIGMVHMEMGKKEVARIDFMQVKKTYPDSTAAQLAALRLKQLSAE